MCDTQTVANARSIHEQEWAGLLARIAVGDPSALAEFYDASSAKVFGLAMKILGDRAAAEEATLDVYTQIWRRISTYDAERGTPGSWLMTLAKHRAIDRFRSSYLERGRHVPLEQAAELSGHEDTPEQYSVGLERHPIGLDATVPFGSQISDIQRNGCTRKTSRGHHV